MKFLKKKFHKLELSKKTFIIPSIIGFSLFYIIPFIGLIYYSFVNNPIQKEFVGLQNYILILQNEAFLTAVKNSVSFSALAIPLGVGVSLFLALILDESIPGRSLFRTFILSPLMVSSASIILVWQVFFSYDGTCNQFLEEILGAKIDFFHSKYGLLVVLLLFLWKNLGYFMIIYMASLGEIPKDMIEAAYMDGGSNFQVFCKIKLPFLSPTILFVTLLCFVNSFKIFKEVYLLVGNYPYDTMYLLQHFMNNTFLSLDYQKLATATIMLTTVMSITILVLFLLEHHVGKDFET